MSNTNLKYITIGGVDYSRYLPFPFEETLTLDASLSTATVRLVNTRIAIPFKPFERVRLGRGVSARWYIVSDDRVTEHHGTGLYEHSIGLVEQTKETERIMTGGKAFTNPLVKDYSDGKTPAKLVSYNSAGSNNYMFSSTYTASNLSSPVLTGDFILNQDDFLFGFDEGVIEGDMADVSVYFDSKSPLILKRDEKGDWDGKTFSFDENKKLYGDTYEISDKIQYSFGNPGLYVIRYELGSYTTFRGLFAQIYVSSKPVARSTYTIDQIIYQRLQTAETLRLGEYPRYRLVYQGDQLERFQQPAPEMHFPNGRTLCEDLQEIGKVIHAIPRIEDDRLYFDDLGGIEYADMSKGKPYSGESLYSISDYTAALESYANNLANLDDESEGSVTEPFNGGFVSLRANVEEVRIGETTGLIRTSLPIEKLLKVTAIFRGKEGDITPYIFEKSEYDLLSSYSGNYPTSKTYALYYNRGGTTIEGLWYKAQDSGLSIIDALESYAIVNILRTALNEPLIVLNPNEYPDIMFSVSYIPTVNARVRNYRPDFDGRFPSILPHNQAENKLSSRQFGENLRGQLAMLGTTSDSKMYIFKSADDLPKVGTLYDKDNYISSIIARHYHGFTLAQIQLSTGYNQLGARVEINNAIRQFEIPAAEDRYILYEEFCNLGTKQDDDTSLAMTENMKESIYRIFDGANTYADGMDVSLAIVKTYDKDRKPVSGFGDDTEIALPVVSLSLGNSLYFGFRFLDNFSAGTSATGDAQEIEGKYYREQAHIPYGDPWYSEATYMTMSLWTGAENKTIDTAKKLPIAGDIAKGTQMLNIPEGSSIMVYKDSADALYLNYQVHFITDDGYIIGDGLSHACAAVRTVPDSSTPRLYFFPHRINQLTGTIDTSLAVATTTVLINRDTRRVRGVSKPTVPYQSWAIIKGGRFIIGKNASSFDGFYISFRRRLIK